MELEKIFFKNDLLVYVFPEGIPRNSLVVIAGKGGTAKSIVVCEIVKDVLSMGEPVIYVSVDDDPATVASQLESFGVDVKESTAKGLLAIIDSFSYLIKGKKGRAHESVVEEVDSRNVDVLLSAIMRNIEARELAGRGMVVVDSINEIMMSLDPVKFVEFVKSLRANIAKQRKVLTIVTIHTTMKEFKEYLYSIDFMVDGLIETKNVQSALANQIPFPVRQLSVKKMKGVYHRTGWTIFAIDKTGVKPVVVKYK